MIEIKHDTSMIEIAYALLVDYNKEIHIKKEHIVYGLKDRKSKQKIDELSNSREGIYFHDLFNKIAELKGFSEDIIDDKRTQFYTDLTLNGQFIMTTGNYWDLTNNHYCAERTLINTNLYDEYDEESIRAAKENFVRMKQKNGEDTTIDMQYIMEHIDELLQEDDDVDIDEVEESEGIEMDI